MLARLIRRCSSTPIALAILPLAVLPLATLTACGSDYQFHAASPMLDDVKASPLLVAPKTLEPTFETTLIGADTGGGTDPLTGADAQRATRFYGEFARNARGSASAGSLQWCPATPQKFDTLCGQPLADGEKVYFSGMVGSIKVRAFGFGYPHPPTKAGDFTSSIAQMPWAGS